MSHVSIELGTQWIAAARRGDANAFAQIVRRYQTPVYNLAYRMMGDTAEAEDAAQETFLRAYLQLKQYDSQRAFSSWLLSIAAHYCIDRLRRNRFVGPSLDADETRDTLAATTPMPDELMLVREQTTEVQILLNQLPPRYRAVVVLKYWHDFSLDDIARMTGDSVGAVKVKLYRARQALARASQKTDARLESARSNEVKGAGVHASGY